MKIIFFLIIISLLLAGGFLVWFLSAASQGEFEDTTTPGFRVLFDDNKPSETQQKQ